MGGPAPVVPRPSSGAGRKELHYDPPQRLEPKCTPLLDLDAGLEGNFRPTTVTDGMGVDTDDIASIAENAFAGKLSSCAAPTRSTKLRYHLSL